MHGFCPQDGAIFAVSLQAELARAGNESFWINFEEFKEWVSATFKATVMPFMTPYPNSTHIAYRTRFQQFLCELRLRWMGDLHGGIDWTYGLWRPLVELFIEEKVKFDVVPVPPVLVKERHRWRSSARTRPGEALSWISPSLSLFILRKSSFLSF